MATSLSDTTGGNSGALVVVVVVGAGSVGGVDVLICCCGCCGCWVSVSVVLVEDSIWPASLRVSSSLSFRFPGTSLRSTGDPVLDFFSSSVVGGSEGAYKTNFFYTIQSASVVEFDILLVTLTGVDWVMGPFFRMVTCFLDDVATGLGGGASFAFSNSANKPSELDSRTIMTSN